MTISEAQSVLHCPDAYGGIYGEKYGEALNMAMEALKGEPCEDCISRQAVLEYIEGSEAELGHSSENELVCQDIKELPSVTPKPKPILYSGDGYADGCMVYDMAECPNCGYEYEDGDKDWGLPFCPNCGQSLNWEGEGE